MNDARMAARKKPVPSLDVGATIERISQEVAERGACIRAACKVPKAFWPEVQAKLTQRGLEVTPKFVRRPLRDQLLTLLATGAVLPLAGTALARHVSGAAGPEAAKAALALVQSKEAQAVMRARGLFLVGPTANVIPLQALSPSIKAIDATLKLAKKAATKKVSLLREDFDALLAPVCEAARPTPAQASTPSSRSVVEVALGLVDSSVGLAFVPAVVRALAAGSTVQAARAALLDAAGRGQVELRPESGLGRLRDEDRDLCIPALDGTPLSWLRIVKGSR
jgi:hypothetical protein